MPAPQNWESGIVAGLQPLLRSNNAETSFSREQLLRTYAECEKAQQTATPDMPYSQLLATVLPHVASRLGLSTAPTAEQCAAFGASVGSWPAFPDTVDALQRLGRRYKLVVLSNVDRSSFERTLAGPLRDVRFDAVITAQDVGSYKPDPRNFAYMLREARDRFGVPQARVLQTAQSQFHDHRPARRAGIKSCWIVRPGAVIGDAKGGDDADAVYDWKFNTLGDMADALEAELAEGAKSA
ncbi:hypothetical protein ACRE_053110 [Hapsidospora chrysogenum ATCC 11550]|uniref:Uncharacterized protein n=1 Tax=Hapsidospora chrysogenum (strain ATCC 11550 / CBS 779.69 / DSM 880 / IAM 14645 / JCM 23072 / IMI 49137) TaxID=857340 RepID=A0A086T3I2_HAPC1|nr:hypothetical protein ACRE_053110 [Hapsidospora chrysogenum ATCC 11550]